MLRKGKYIVIEGADGVGKTTQTERLKERAIALGYLSRVLREPGGDEMGEAIRGHLLASELERTAEAETLLFWAARMKTLEVIGMLRDAGTIVFSDRNWLSTLAYQHYGKGASRSFVDRIAEACMAEVKVWPDLIIVLDLEPEIVAARRPERPDDYFEKLGDEFHQNVRSGFLTEGGINGFPIIVTSGTEEEVEEQIWHHVEPLLEG